MKRSIILITVLLVSVLLLSVFSASAQLEILPRLTLEEEYTDNLFLSDSDEQEDWVTTVEPGISLAYNARSVDVLVDYSLRYLFYQEHDDRNIEEFKDVQRADATASFFAGRPFTLMVSELITREALDERDVNADSNDLVNRTTVYNTQVVPEYRLELTPSFSLVFGYTYDRVDYVANDGNDYEEHSGRISAVKDLSSNTSVSLNYTYLVYQEETGEDYDQQDYTVGFNQQVGPRLSVASEVGFSTIEYDDGRDTEDTTGMLSVTYGLSEALTLSADYDQGFSTSATEGLTKSRSASLGLGYVKNELTASAELFWNQTDYETTAREDEAIGARLDLNIPLSVAFSTSFDAEYEQASFEDVTDEDVDRYSLGAALNYEYRRFLASLGYRYRSNNSDIDVNDFINNTVTLSGTVRF